MGIRMRRSASPSWSTPMPADSRDKGGEDEEQGAPGALDLTVARRIHVVGIGGAGMSAIAQLLRDMGHSVTGSDLKDSPVAERLRSHGIAVAVGHRAENLGDAEAVTYSPAVAPDNSELEAAAARGVRVMPRSEMLAAICATRKCLAVAGTHGKTTTASMLSLILVEAGLRPSFVIGADVNEIGTNAVWDTGEWLVVEADESYGTFTAIRPDLAVLTNVEPDHLDYYETFDALRAAFDRFVGAASEGAVVCSDDPEAAAIGLVHGAVTVGSGADATYRIEDLTDGRSAASFVLNGPDGRLGPLRIGVPGRHNARNAAVAAVAALRVGAPFETAQAALARFAGVPRRFEFRGEARGVTFVDDYAHLPTEVRSVLATARAGGWSRVVAVFQPHRFSRTARLAEQFGTAFSDADLLVVTDVYSAGERPIPGVSGRLVADAVRAQDPRLAVTYAPGWEELARVVGALLRPGDLCLTLGAGDLTALPDVLLESAEW
jgi:UDP-N-acetylmuramate--alanine ligase